MRIQTLSVVIGTSACNARCPFCVSRMTGPEPTGTGKPTGRARPTGTGKSRVNWHNFAKACRLAASGGVSTVLLTGKGEPTLCPDEIQEYLQALESRGFPLIELQTNGISLGRLAGGGKPAGRGLDAAQLRRWHQLGLNTLAISAVSDAVEANRRCYGPAYPELDRLADYLHDLGFTVRLCVMMQRGDVDSPTAVTRVVDFCRRHGIEQLTARSIRRPATSQDPLAKAYVDAHSLWPAQESEIRHWAANEGTKLMSLLHGATVYDVDGQNFCLSDCLTLGDNENDIRSLIFYSDGRLAYDWQYPGAVILGGSAD